MTRKDHTGLKYGMLTVLRFSHTDGDGKSARAVWLCRCDCGRERTFRAEWLTRRTNPATHCGCSKVYTQRAGKPKGPVSPKSAYKHAAYKVDAPSAEERRMTREGEKSPPPGDWRKSIIVAARRSFTPWKDAAELAGVTVEEAKALFNSAA